jgi:stage II sporulation protein D
VKTILQMALLLGLASAAWAQTVTVRVLGRLRPSSVVVAATRAACDGAEVAIESTATLAGAKVAWGERTCTRLVLTGPVRLRAAEVDRTYLGDVEISAAGAELKLVNRVDVEAYLPSVVGAELDQGPSAALQAQAIVSRTFALAGKGRHSETHLCDLAHCQVYRGVETAPAPVAAVRATKQQVLLAGFKLVPAYYHAICGGFTTSGAEVFGERNGHAPASDVSKGVAACASDSRSTWTHEVDRHQLAESLGIKDEGAAVEPLRRDAHGRLLEVRLFGKRMTASEALSRLGRALGWQAVPSAHFSTTEAEGAVRFVGRGVGHGVGLCQIGATALAQRGLSATAILATYFPGSVVRAAPPE